MALQSKLVSNAQSLDGCTEALNDLHDLHGFSNHSQDERREVLARMNSRYDDEIPHLNHQAAVFEFGCDICSTSMTELNRSPHRDNLRLIGVVFFSRRNLSLLPG